MHVLCKSSLLRMHFNSPYYRKSSALFMEWLSWCQQCHVHLFCESEIGLIPEKRLSLGLCLLLFSDRSLLNRPTWVLRIICRILLCNCAIVWIEDLAWRAEDILDFRTVGLLRSSLSFERRCFNEFGKPESIDRQILFFHRIAASKQGAQTRSLVIHEKVAFGYFEAGLLLFA